MAGLDYGARTPSSISPAAHGAEECAALFPTVWIHLVPRINHYNYVLIASGGRELGFRAWRRSVVLSLFALIRALSRRRGALLEADASYRRVGLL